MNEYEPPDPVSHCSNPACGARLAAPAQQCLRCGSLLSGTTLSGRYRIEQLLGRGGMGAVYRATDLTLDRQVAAKVLAPAGNLAGGAPEELRQRFIREARLAAQLDHPQIVPVLHFASDGLLSYLIMPWLSGGTLADQVARQAPRDPVLVLGWLRQFALALDYAHQRPQPIVHRDVKPSNLLFHQDGRLCLADFGIARVVAAEQAAESDPVTQAGVILGSLAFIAPEQIQGHAVPASDQYSVGVLLYELLTGAHPFRATDPATLLMQHLTTLPAPPSTQLPLIPAEIDAVVLRALAKAPEARFPSMEALVAALETALVPASSLGSESAALSPADVNEPSPDDVAAAEEDPMGELPTQAVLGLRFLAPPMQAGGSRGRLHHQEPEQPSSTPWRGRAGLMLAAVTVLLLISVLAGLQALRQGNLTHEVAQPHPHAPVATATTDPHLAALLAAERNPVLFQDALLDNHQHWSLPSGAQFTPTGLELMAPPTGSNQAPGAGGSSATLGSLHLAGGCALELDLTLQGGSVDYGVALLALVPPSVLFHFSPMGTYQVAWYAGEALLGTPVQGQAPGLVLTASARYHLALLLHGQQVSTYLNAGTSMQWITTLSAAAPLQGVQALVLQNLGNATGGQEDVIYTNVKLYQA